VWPVLNLLSHLAVPETLVWANADPTKAVNKTTRPSDLYVIVFPLEAPLE
jgi:hypothetical protein